LSLDVPPSPLDATALRRAVLENRLANLVADEAPHPGAYQALRDALTRYRVLARDATLPLLPTTSLPKGSIHPGDPLAGAAALHARLRAFGDVSPETPAPINPVLTPALAEGLKRFQARHGLLEDGILGKRTLTALEVPLASRVRQIELALERLRWIPRDITAPLLIVNIPMFRLWAYEPSAAETALTMKVIVGCAVKTETPVFAAELQSVIFRPYWNVPRSILRAEILPRIRRDPGYLARNHFDIVRGDGDDAVAVPLTPEALTELAQGTLRVRQRPGPDNALGLIKFDLPNQFTVYMHGTPAMKLFEQPRRDFSHGCVRVEDPVALAQWVLNDPMWSSQAVVAATGAAHSQRIPVTRPARVLLFYTTAAVLPDGAIHFADDIYGHDAILDRALRRATGR
jgi:murein L,D-transpeptidase YcbB/YkuD